VGQDLATTQDGQPSVGSSSTTAAQTTATGSYDRTIVFGLHNVPSECRALQIDVADTDRARVDADVARLSNRGLFLSDVPLVIGSEDRAAAPAVVACNAPAGAPVAAKQGGTVTGAGVYRAPADALKSFLEAHASLIRNQYLEVHLPDGTIAYAKEQPMRPGSYVTVVHVTPTGAGWSVDRWEASGC
jgi:hypothetical protein